MAGAPFARQIPLALPEKYSTVDGRGSKPTKCRLRRNRSQEELERVKKRQLEKELVLEKKLER